MRAMNRVLIPLSSLCLVSAAVAQQKQLQPVDMFRLNYRMNAGAEDPVAWLWSEDHTRFEKFLKENL
ncbi:MAG: hypothetical protein ACI85K_001500 [Hyphomicrobiaceae bacterium]|jgi:hypothetical protein